MLEELVIFGWVALIYLCVMTTYLVKRKVFDPSPLTFLEFFLYVEDRIEKKEAEIKEEKDEEKRKSFEKELRQYEQIKRLLETLRSDK